MQTKREKTSRVIVLIAVGVIVVGLACLAAGVALMVKYSKVKNSKIGTPNGVYTAEARNSGLNSLLKKLQETHFELYPERMFMKPNFTPEEVRQKFKSYDPSPARLKYIADKSRKLLAEFENLKITTTKLSLREKKAFEQAKFWVRHVFPFGIPFGYDYYIGDWLRGPDVFCWMPICFVMQFFEVTMLYFKPSNVQDMEVFRDKLIEVNRTFAQYVENLKLGINVGMVRNIEGCKSGLDGIRYKDEYLSIAMYGVAGVFNSTTYLKLVNGDFLAQVNTNPAELEAWRKKYGKDINQSLKEYYMEHVGKPINYLFRYLETEYMQYCVPSNMSQGFSSLPMSYVYHNGKPIRPTTQRLPSGEKIDGHKSYRKLLSYFTSTDTTPEEIHKLGRSLIDRFYAEILEVAKEYTGLSNNTKAKAELMRKVRGNDMYFSDGELPASESNQNAYRLCSSIEGAKKHCPKRWKAIQKWFMYSRQIMAELDAKMINLFHFAGKKHTTPNCPVDLVPEFNPSVAAQGYTESDETCSRAAVYSIPFFLKKAGPRYEEWTVSAHETRPGHHLQAQGYKERFLVADEGVIKWLADITYFLGFQEGWAMYAENPLIAKDTDTYKGKPLLKYGMLKWQLWQALRLILDTGFHSMNMTRDEARELIEKYIWDTTDIPDKEITRYQSLPGHATTYLVGKLHIMKLRQLTQRRLGDKFKLKDFHFQILKHGPSPFSFLEYSIKKYIDCVLNPKLEGCDEVLNPPKLKESSSRNEEVYIMNGRKLHFWHRR